MSLFAKSKSILSSLRAVTTRKPVRRVPMLVEELEPRILHSADIGPALLHDGSATTQVESRVLDASGEFFADAAESQQARSLELVIVDTRTPDYQQLVDDMRLEAADGRQTEVVLLDNRSNGLDQITSLLAGRKDIGAVHIISHGSEGTVQLGGSVLDLESLRAYAVEIESWANALTPDADLLIYGCNVAGSPDGRTLVDALSRLTGADVAASENLTGNAVSGGDWNFEYATGRIETSLAIDEQTRQVWTGVLANTAPVLSGAENLTTIAEDPGTNPGTQVSALLAAHVTDPDAGALSGIAITAADNTNGSWQFSTDAGGTWNNLGSPSDTSARLLRSSDFVRFVPNADWNGTVNNGLTFRAWDQTSGVNGSTGDTITLVGTVRDDFSAVGYANNDGSAAWSANWVDTDGLATGGSIRVSPGGQLQLQSNTNSDSIYRQANLTGATSATLSFDYDNQLFLGLGGGVLLELSGDGGASYTTLTTFSPVSNGGTGSYSADISAYIATNTQVRFSITGISLPTQNMFVDNLQIAYTVSAGSIAFSSATAASSITVAPANDAPMLSAPASIAVTEDGATAITGISFSDVDAGSGSVLATFTVPQGTLGAVSGSGVIVGGSATALTLTGSIANINAFIAASSLTYTTAPNDTSAVNLGVAVDDQGNIGSGGAQSSAVSNVTLNVTAFNDPPIGANNTVSTAEDSAYTFGVGDFGFSDPSDTPADNLLAVKITTLPGAGALTLSGVAVTAGQFVSRVDVAAGNLQFTSTTDANGTGYASFTFQVRDDGGGADLDPSARTMTIDVTAIDDAPVNSVPGTQATNQDTALVFSTAGGNGISISDVDAGSGAVQFSLSASNGSVNLATTAGLIFAVGTGSGDATMQFSGSIAAINAALNGLRFTPGAGFTGAAALSIVTDDLGNTGSGGPLTASSTVNINVAAAPILPPTTPVIPIIDPILVPVPVPPTVVADPVTPPPPTPVPTAGPDAPPLDEVPSAGGRVEPEAAAPPADLETGSDRSLAYTLTAPSTRNGGLVGVSYTLPAAQWLMFGDEPVASITDGREASFGLGVTGDGRSALQSPALIDALDRLRDGLQEESRIDALVVATTAAASVGLSVGYVLWLLRGGLLISSMLSSLPAWRLVDPLPILGRFDDEDDQDADDDSIEYLIAANNAAPIAPPVVPAEPEDTKSLAG